MPAPRPILIVDDDAPLRASLAEHFSARAGFDPDQAGSAAEAEAKLAAAARARPHDVLLLDTTLPDGDGREVCARLREGGLRIPIVMLAGSGEERDVVGALDAGANDYVTKPFRTGELMARVRAQLRAFDASEDAALAVGPYVFRPAARLLTDAAGGRRQVRLTSKENALLRFLCRAGGEAVPRRVLLDAVWRYRGEASTRALDMCVHSLRRKLEPDSSRPRLLLTVSGGYRLGPEDMDRRTFGEAFRSEGGI
ncbi:MAG: response regulator transcription factor [Acetobacteraceae bacterium]|nr:response regulator transcription factor [Acetobacteraceae bacterium]